MPEEWSERTVEGFWNREFDILGVHHHRRDRLTSPNANTLIVERADMFGLSQLHQLRAGSAAAANGLRPFLYPPEVP